MQVHQNNNTWDVDTRSNMRIIEDHRIDRIIEIDKIGRFSFIGFRPRVEGDWHGAAFHGAKEVIVQFHHISYLEFQSISSVSIQSRQSRSAAVLAILHSFDSTKCTGVVDLLPGAFLFAKPKSIVGFELPSSLRWITFSQSKYCSSIRTSAQWKPLRYLYKNWDILGRNI